MYRQAFVAPPRLNLGELIDVLAARPKDQTVRFDIGSLYPTRLMSYRGYYEQLALGYMDRDDKGSKGFPNVDAVLAELRSAIGATFTGYKGGEYVMRSETPLWVANYGNTSETIIVGVCDNDYQTVLATAYEPA